MTATHPRIHIVAACRALESPDGEIVERVAPDGRAEFWGHYIVGVDGRQLWVADYESLSVAIAAARQRGARRLLLDDGDRFVVIR